RFGRREQIELPRARPARRRKGDQEIERELAFDAGAALCDLPSVRALQEALNPFGRGQALGSGTIEALSLELSDDVRERDRRAPALERHALEHAVRGAAERAGVVRRALRLA